MRERSAGGGPAAENTVNLGPKRRYTNWIQAASPPKRGETPWTDPAGVGIDTKPLEGRRSKPRAEIRRSTRRPRKRSM